MRCVCKGDASTESAFSSQHSAGDASVEVNALNQGMSKLAFCHLSFCHTAGGAKEFQQLREGVNGIQGLRLRQEKPTSKAAAPCRFNCVIPNYVCFFEEEESSEMWGGFIIIRYFDIFGILISIIDNRKFYVFNIDNQNFGKNLSIR